MRSRGSRWWLVPLAVAVTALAACALPTLSGPAPSAPASTAPAPTADEAPGAGTPGKPDAAELAGDIDTAVNITNQFWATHWSEFFTGTYTPPLVTGLYGEPYTSPTCGGQPPVPDNAFYCATGEDFLAWDAGLMAQGAEMGDAWVYLVVAHEWAHAIQNRLAQNLESVGAELQADCLAGAALYGAVQDGTLQFEAGDERELANSLSALADETPWTREGDHGDTFQRISAFDRGRSGGVAACLPTS